MSDQHTPPGPDDGGPPDEEEALMSALSAEWRTQEAAEIQDWPDEGWSGEEALAPIGGAEADAMFEALAPMLGANAEVESATEGPPVPVVPALPESPATVTAPGMSRRWAVWGGLTTLVAAAAIIFMIMQGPAGPALPGYTLSGAGDQAFRADPAAAEEVVQYSAGSRVRFIARPASAIQEPITARLYVRTATETTRVESPIITSPSGAVKIDAVLGQDIRLPEGEGTLILLIKPASLGADDLNLIEAEDPSPAQRLSQRYRLSP